MRLRDADGDIWESDSEGGWTLIQLLGRPIADPEGGFGSRETLELVWGPLSEMTE